MECATKFKSNEPQETLRKIFNQKRKNLRKTLRGRITLHVYGGCMPLILVFRQLTKHYFGNDGRYCAVVNCGTNRRTKGIGIFKLPSKKLHPERRKEWLNEITKTRTVDAHSKNKIENDTVYTCEQHFAEEDVEICKYLNSFLLYDFEAICAQKQSFLASLKPVTTTSPVNYFKGFFVCRGTKFLPLRVSRMLLQLIHISLQAVTIRSSPSQTTRSQPVTLLK